MFKGPYVTLKLPFRSGLQSSGHFPDITVQFAPYRHQERAYERLSGDNPQFTLVANRLDHRVRNPCEAGNRCEAMGGVILAVFSKSVAELSRIDLLFSGHDGLVDGIRGGSCTGVVRGDDYCNTLRRNLMQLSCQGAFLVGKPVECEGEFDGVKFL